MANTSSAKKAARKIARRAAVNKIRRSRVRSYVRKVEEALASGDKKRGRGGIQCRAAGVDARRDQGRAAQEHGIAQGFATRAAGKGALRLSRLPIPDIANDPARPGFLFAGQ